MGFENPFWKHLITKADGSLILTSIMQGCNLRFGKFKTSKCHSEINWSLIGINYLAVFLVTFMALSCQGKKVPKVIKSLNKALGLPSKSKVVWDILNIEGIDNEVEDVAAKVDKYHPNTTSTTSIPATVTATVTVTTTSK